MLVAAVLCAVQAIKNISSPVFAKMVVSLISTYGIYVVSSFMALDPWLAGSLYRSRFRRLIIRRHIFTCFIQYLLFSPSKFLMNLLGDGY